MKIDAENLLVGRIATFAAKRALLGETVEIINCDKAVLSGTKKHIVESYLQKQKRGTHRKGPFYYTKPDRFVKRIIRGMLPHRQDKGSKALKRIKCFQGVPQSTNKAEFKSIESTHFRKLRSTRYVYVKDICRAIGGK